MKKILFGMMAATAMLFTSCSQEDLAGAVYGEEANVSVSLSLPQIQSRAYSDGLSANHLQYAVYDVTSGTPELLDNYTVTDAVINLSTTVNFKLVNGHKYGLLFWAASPNADDTYKVTFGPSSADMKVTYDSKVLANSDDFDAFYSYQEITVSGDRQISAVLTRPFAQVNVGTNDYDEAEALGYAPTLSRMVVKNTYSTLNLMDGSVSDPVQVTYNYGAIKTDESFPVEGYDYLSMAYVLAPTDEPDLVTVVFYYGKAGETAQSRQVGSVPVQRNFRTNLFGQVLTSNAEVNVIIEPDYLTPDNNFNELIFQAAVGGTITLGQNETVEQDMIFRKDGVLNLNGFSLTENNSTLTVAGTSNLVINGDGSIVKTGQDAFGSTAAVYVNSANATVTINGGNITSNGTEAVFVNVGTAYITGGYFAAASDYNGKMFTINCNDTNFKNGTAKIIVSGGTFENFNPAESNADFNADGTPGNLLAPNCKSIPVTINGKQCYTVVPNDVDVVTSDPEEAQQALADGKNVTLVGETMTVVTNKNNTPYKTGFVVKDGLTLDGGNAVVTFDGSETSTTNDNAVYVTNGTLKNLTILGGPNKAILVDMDNKADIFIDNVQVPANSRAMYGINVNEGNGSHSLYVTNSLFTGWCSWGVSAKTVSFTNCEFGIGTHYSSSSAYAVYNGLVKPHTTTVFDNCRFDEMIYIDLSTLADGKTVTFKNCYVNGQKLTKANHATLLKGAVHYGEPDWEDYARVADRIFFE